MQDRPDAVCGHARRGVLLQMGGMVCGAAAVLAGAHAWAAPAAAQTMAGDVIVKFRDSSASGAMLAAVLAGQRSAATAAPVAERLAAELGVPLRLVQVTSGREALLAIDREALMADLAQRAQRDSAVRRFVPHPPPPGLPPAELVFQVLVKPGSSLPELARRLSLDGLVRATATAEPHGATLRYDLNALTQALLQRLQQQPEVEYAQANRLLRHTAPR